MPRRYRPLFRLVLLGSTLWVVDAALDALFFHPSMGFIDLVLLDVPAREVQARTVALVLLALAAAILARRPASDAGLAEEQSEKKLAERRIEHLNAVLRALTQVKRILLRARNRGDLVQGVCEGLIETRGYARAWVLLIDPNGTPKVAATAGMDEYASAALTEGIEQGTAFHCLKSALGESGARVLPAPARSCPGCPVGKDLHQGAALSVRLEHDGTVLGILAAYAPTELLIDPEETRLLEGLGADLAMALVGLESGARRAQLEDQLRLARRMEALGRLAGGIAHDFNNLLTAINGYSEIALERLQEGDPCDGELKEILRAGKRAASFTGQLLAFSRRQVLQPETLDLNRLISDMQPMLQRLIGEHIQLTCQTSADRATLLADRGQLEQVLLNLVINARDAMPDGGTLTIQVSTSGHPDLPGDPIRLSVIDSGSGMDQETLDRVFEPLFTTKGPGRGTGLGLATAYGIVEQSGGRITAESTPGAGSAFHVFLPLAFGPVSPAADPAPGPRDPGGVETILVVEDERVVLDLAVSILEGSGYTVLSAKDGPEALGLSQGHPAPIHLLFTDIILPGMNGPELARRFLETRPATRVLFTSGYSTQIGGQSTLLAPESPFLAKPYPVAALLASVREALDREEVDVHTLFLKP